MTHAASSPDTSFLDRIRRLFRSAPPVARPSAPDPASPLGQLRMLAPDRVPAFITAVHDEIAAALPEFRVAAKMGDMHRVALFAHAMKNAALSLGMGQDAKRAQELYEDPVAGREHLEKLARHLLATAQRLLTAGV